MVDARGLVCPMPIVMVQKAVKQDAPDTLTVLVDDRCAVENVTRFAKHSGYQVAVTEENGEYTLTLTK